MQIRQGTYGAITVELEPQPFHSRHHRDLPIDGFILKDENEAYELRDLLIDFLSGRSNNDSNPLP